MPRRAKSVCNKIGCFTLVSQPGYCEKHKKESNPYEELNKKKTTETKKFYSSYAWTKKSKQHRKKEPLCQECLRKDIIKNGELVHHEPELTELLKKGLNPLDDKYLETLCHNCHQGHLRAKKK